MVIPNSIFSSLVKMYSVGSCENNFSIKLKTLLPTKRIENTNINI